MTRTLIALWGVANVGKSSTIRALYKLLKSKYRNAKIKNLGRGSDVCAIFTIGKTKIGIEHHGDPDSRLEESLKKFVKEKCKVIICATRSRGRTAEAVYELDQDYDVIWLEKQRTQDNEDLARLIFLATQGAMKG